MFYINYEECKLLAIAKVLSFMICFILTMRNVNTITKVQCMLCWQGFILTMRNVNKYLIKICCLSPIVLY